MICNPEYPALIKALSPEIKALYALLYGMQESSNIGFVGSEISIISIPGLSPARYA